MTTVAKDARPVKPRPRKPLAPVPLSWQWLYRPLFPCTLLPDGSPGLMLLNKQVYLVSVLGELPADGPVIVRGVRFTKADGSVYDVSADTFGCDCGDGTYRPERPHGCKHARAAREWLTQIGMEPAGGDHSADPHPCPFEADGPVDADW